MKLRWPLGVNANHKLVVVRLHMEVGGYVYWLAGHRSHQPCQYTDGVIFSKLENDANFSHDRTSS